MQQARGKIESSPQPDAQTFMLDLASRLRRLGLLMKSKSTDGMPGRR
jgi:hypothetical protein